jgi:hypothetical protein
MMPDTGWNIPIPRLEAIMQTSELDTEIKNPTILNTGVLVMKLTSRINMFRLSVKRRLKETA